MTTPSKLSASSRASADLPLAVGPVDQHHAGGAVVDGVLDLGSQVSMFTGLIGLNGGLAGIIAQNHDDLACDLDTRVIVIARRSVRDAVPGEDHADFLQFLARRGGEREETRLGFEGVRSVSVVDGQRVAIRFQRGLSANGEGLVV